MQEENKRCYNCGNFRAYYIKGESQFVKSDVGECSKLSYAVRDKHGCCDEWRPKTKYCHRALPKIKLAKILNQLLSIRQIMQEDKEGD